MVVNTLDSRSVFNTYENRGIKRGGIVKTFPDGDGKAKRSGAYGGACVGVVAGTFVGLSFKVWRVILNAVVALHLIAIFRFIIEDLRLDAFFGALTAGLYAYIDVEGHMVKRLAFNVANVVCGIGLELVRKLDGIGLCVPSSVASTISVYVVLVAMVHNSKVSPNLRSLTESEMVIALLTSVGTLFFAYGLALNSTGYVLRFISVVMTIIAFGAALPYWLRRQQSGLLGFAVVLKLVFSMIVMLVSPVLGVLALYLYPESGLRNNVKPHVASEKSKHIAEVYTALGLESSRIELCLSAKELSDVGSGVQGIAETPNVRLLAYIGDRALSLALARRAGNQEWSVEYCSNMSQRTLSNAAFARYYDVYLSGVLPALRTRSEKRKATCVEALVGAYYQSGGSVEAIEWFLFAYLQPLVVSNI